MGKNYMLLNKYLILLMNKKKNNLLKQNIRIMNPLLLIIHLKVAGELNNYTQIREVVSIGYSHIVLLILLK